MNNFFLKNLCLYTILFGFVNIVILTIKQNSLMFVNSVTALSLPLNNSKQFYNAPKLVPIDHHLIHQYSNYITTSLKTTGNNPNFSHVYKIPRLPTNYDDIFFDTFHQGSIELPSGMIVNVFQHLCAGPEYVAFIARDNINYHHLKFCCEYDTKIKHNCSALMMGLCNANFAKKNIRTEIWNSNNNTINKYLYLPGTSWWMYTPGKQEHIGHNINRMLQLFHARQDPRIPNIDWIVSNRMALPNGKHNLHIVSTIIGDMIVKTWLRHTLESLPYRTLCMQRVMEVDISMHERLMFTKEQAQSWRRYAQTNFFPQGSNWISSQCPPPNAVVLQRVEGSGLRSILNYNVLERVLRRNNIYTYKNVSVSSHNTTAEHVSLFSNFGLMISPHSSQLKNMIFTQRGAIILEVQPTPPGYLEPSPFYWGSQELEIIFELSKGHIPDLTSCPDDHGCIVIKRYKTDFWLVEDLFEISLKQALSKQYKKCGNIWSQT